MVFKTIINFTCGLYRFYAVLPMGKTDCFTQFYPILPNWFYPLPTLLVTTLVTSFRPYHLSPVRWCGVNLMRKATGSCFPSSRVVFMRIVASPSAILPFLMSCTNQQQPTTQLLVKAANFSRVISF